MTMYEYGFEDAQHPERKPAHPRNGEYMRGWFDGLDYYEQFQYILTWEFPE